MTNSTLNITANINAHSSIITPRTTIMLGLCMANAIIPSIIIYTGNSRCETVVTTIPITVVVIITTSTMIAINTTIIASMRLLSLLLLTVCLY